MLARIRKAQQEKEGGFTLIELLVVMIIIGILAAIAIPVFLSQRAKAQDSATKADVSTIGKELATFYVDGTGTVVSRTPSEHWEVVEVSLPADLVRYLVPKGSITVDGISLTVVEVRPDSFTVSLIPETLARTTLGARQPGETVNLEVDVIAKYVEKMVRQ